MSVNAILKSREEIERASGEFKEIGIFLAKDNDKAWDMGRALNFIRGHKKKNAYILDAGTFKSRLLEFLYKDGYRNLYGCDICGVEWKWVVLLYLGKMRLWDLLRWIFGNGPIQLSRQDLQRTKYPSGQFDFITCISVIEHGVDKRLYLKEMSRLLKPGGYLITSCDYWPQPIDTAFMLPYGLSWNIQTQTDIQVLIKLAAEYSLYLEQPMDFSCANPIIKWKGKEYTFAFFILKKAD